VTIFVIFLLVALTTCRQPRAELLIAGTQTDNSAQACPPAGDAWRWFGY
jgi:hypothetical protein